MPKKTLLETKQGTGSLSTQEKKESKCTVKGCRHTLNKQQTNKHAPAKANLFQFINQNKI